MSSLFPVLEAVEYKNKALYIKVKEAADKKFAKDSYVKNLWIIREYKKRGGEVGYEGKKPSNTSIQKQVKSHQDVFTVSYCAECSDSEFGTEELVICEVEAKEAHKKLNKPFRTPKGPKKFSVYVKNDKGNIVKVNFGSPDMAIRRDEPARRKSFRARMRCDSPGPKWKARYWACKTWEAGKTVTQIVS